MSNETKQPTLPEAIALAREALNHAQNQTYPFGGLELFAKALAALDSLQVGVPVTDHIEDVRGMVPVAYGVSSINAIDGSVGWDFIADFEQAAHDHINDQIMRFQDEGLEVDEMHVVPLYTHPADCPRCAELEERDLQLRNLLCVIHRDGGHHTQAHGLEQSIEDAKEKFFDLRDLPDTIAQQAERIRILEEEDTDCHRLKDSAICMQAEQLAAAEKDVKRLNDLETLVFNGDVSIEEREPRHSEFRIHTGDTDYDKPFVGRTLREAIDAAAHRKGKS